MRKKKLQTFFDYVKLFKNAHRILRKAFHKSRPSRGFLKERVMKMTTVSSLRPWRDCVTSQSSNVLTRVGLATLVVAFIVLLTACGGGGGGGTTTTPPVVIPPTPVPSGSVKAEPAKCEALVGTDGCTVMVTAQAQNAPNAVLVTPTGQTNVANTTITVPVAVKLGVSRLEVKEGTNVLAFVSVSAECAPGLVLQGTTCMKPTATGILTVPTATVANDASTATVVVSFTSHHTSALTVTLGSETKSVPAGSGQVTFVRTGVADLPVSLKDNGVEIASGVSKASCNSSAAWDTALKLPGKEAGQCTKILCYSEKVSALMGVAATVYAVDVALAPNGAKIAKDQTGWTVANANGYVPPPAKVAWSRFNNPDAFGRVHGAATDSATLTYRKVYWDPLANTINPYGPGTVAPADFNDTSYYDVPTFDPNLDNLPKAEVGGGSYFIYDGNVLSQFDIWYQGKGDPKTVPVLVQADLREFGRSANIKLLSTWTHSCSATQ